MIAKLGDNKFINFNNEMRSYLFDICAPLFKNFGFTSFGYTRYLSDGSRMVLETNQEWFELYHEREFNEKIEGPTSLLYNIIKLGNHEPYINILFGEPKTELHKILFLLDIWNSVSIYIRTAKCIEVYHFGTSKENEKILDFYINRHYLLQRFIFYFREKLLSLNLENSPYTPPNSVFKLCFAPCEQNKLTEEFNRVNTFTRDTAINRFYLITHEEFISKREVECLHYLSLGKSAKEIARVLNISSRTVEQYLSNIKIRFNLYAKNDLINFAFENNINTFIPQFKKT